MRYSIAIDDGITVRYYCGPLPSRRQAEKLRDVLNRLAKGVVYYSLTTTMKP